MSAGSIVRDEYGLWRITEITGRSVFLAPNDDATRAAWSFPLRSIPRGTPGVGRLVEVTA